MTSPGPWRRWRPRWAAKGINITAIVGIAEDTDGALMLATNDAAGTRKAFDGLKLAFDEHDPDAGMTLDDMSRATGLADRGMGAGS